MRVYDEANTPPDALWKALALGQFAPSAGLDLTGAGMGTRSKRYSMLVEDGVVKKLNVEAPGKFEVSGGDTLLKQL